MYVYPGEFVDLGYGRGWLDRKPAASIFRIDQRIGHPIQITEAGRTWERQNEWHQKYLRDGYPIALSPNTPSVHQEGGAVDSDEAQRILAIMHDNGWRRTVYRWINGVWTLVEEWHFEYFEHLDNHRHEGTPAGGNAQPLEDVMNADQEKKLDRVVSRVDWLMERVAGSNESGPSITDLLRAIESDTDRVRTVVGGSLKDGAVVGGNVINRLRAIKAAQGDELTKEDLQEVIAGIIESAGGGGLTQEEITDAVDEGFRRGIDSLTITAVASE